jgi:hypothetical protein
VCVAYLTTLSVVVVQYIIEELCLLRYTAVSSVESQPTFRKHVPPQFRLTFNGLHDDICDNIELFVTTAVRTSNLIPGGPGGKVMRQCLKHMNRCEASVDCCDCS